MTEIHQDRTIHTLSEVTQSIRKAVADRFPAPFWIRAEMNKLNYYPQSGHCYPELVEKTGDRIVAEMKATIWRNDFQRINERFMEVLHEPLKNGIKILILARISFSPVYGMSLGILDIDPSWSLGELEREKQETLTRLKEEGIFDRNRSLEMPLLPARIAVISVETSKGYADFCALLAGNPRGYRLFHMLFPALLQGEKAVPSILAQLERIRKVGHHFDAVAIIRGGGGDVGLTCYNQYGLAKAVALFPLPVITGIGHSTNETVTEMVAYRNAITPTDLAAYLLRKFLDFESPVRQAANILTGRCSAILREGNGEVRNAARHLRSATLAGLAGYRAGIRQNGQRLRSQPASLLRRKREQEVECGHAAVLSASMAWFQERQRGIGNLEKIVELLDPVRVLNRGYSITRSGGRVVRSAGEVVPGDELETWVADGRIRSTVEHAEQKTDNHD